jgi:class 3 adenylate cyclase
MTLSPCKHENSSGAMVCGACGESLMVRCPHCGVALPPTAKFCLECGGATTSKAGDVAAGAPARAHEAGSVEERRQLTVLFCDLVGSTDLAARLDPEDWQDVLRSYQTRASAVVAGYGGHVAQYLGDGLLVYFGWPRSFDDAAERAVRAGLELVGAAASLSSGGEPLRVRVGVHTGIVVMSALGEAGRAEILALGDVPNVAARIQGVAAPGAVLMSAATHRLVAGLFVVEDCGAPPLKGVPEPIALYRVERVSGVGSRLGLSTGRLTPFVGRQHELDLLRDAWQRAVEAQGQAVLVAGEPGVGKSRLCQQLRGQLREQPHTWLECRSSPYTAGTAFHPVIELVRQALGFGPVETPAEKLAKLDRGLTHGKLTGADAVPLLAEWLEIPAGAGYAPLAMSPDVKRRRILEILTAWAIEAGKRRPLVLLVEDLHWCDPSTVELLGRLLAEIDAARLLLVGTARMEFASPWPARSNLQTLTIARLSGAQTRAMVAAVSAEWGLPEAVLRQLAERADGIPLFAEELTRAVVEAGSDAVVAAIPTTLQDSLLARLERLAGAKAVAQRAAVLGREFSYDLLAATAGIEEATLAQGLARLVEADLLFANGVPPHATYTFKHALVRETAYESLLKRARQGLHGAVFDALLRDFPERVTAQPEVLAQHAELAGRIGEAIAFYQRAGEREIGRFAQAEAISDLRRALDLLATQPEDAARDAREVAIQFALAGSLAVARGLSHPEPQTAYERARILCEGQVDERRLCLASIGLSILSFARGEVEQGRVLAAGVLTTAERMGDQELALLAHVQVAIPEHFQGKLVSALAHLEVARALYRPERHHAVVSIMFSDPGVSTLAFMGALLTGLGWPDQGLARAREAVELARRLGHPNSLAQALFFETAIHWARRDPEAQRARAAETIALTAAQGLPYFLGLGRTFHAGARVATGELGAIADLLAGVELAAGAGNLGGAPASFVLLAEAHLATGQVGEARGVVEMGLAVSAQTGQPFWDAELHRLRGEICLLRADDGQEPIDAEKMAEDCFHNALAIAIAQESKSSELLAVTSLARLWQRRGKPAEGRRWLAPVLAWFTEGFDTGDLVAAARLLEELR